MPREVDEIEARIALLNDELAKSRPPEKSTRPSDTKDDAQKIYSAAWWLRQIERHEKTFEQWTRRSEKLLKMYVKQSKMASEVDTDQRRFAMLYANTEVLKPAIYSRPPIPQCSRRFKDKDPAGRLAAELLERGSSYELERQGIDRVFRSVRDDLVLPGRGTVWIRYEPTIEDDDTISDEKVVVDYVNWRDFGHLPARVWDEVDAVWRRVFYSKLEAKRIFDRETADKLVYSHRLNEKGDQSEKSPSSQDDDAEAKAICYEVWCRKTRKQYIVAREVKSFLREPDAPPLDFENFWPCPKPVYSLVSTNNLIPTPDYAHYQDQAQEIDDLTARIAKLTDMLKLVGFYPLGSGDSSAYEKAVDPSVENRMIGVDNWAAFREGGGSRAIEWMPIKEISDTITACVALRTQLVQDVYQISGISDILRGSTDPNETASAQQLKAQWGSIRIKDRQQSMADFCRDVVRLVCEVIAERFEPDRVMKMANMMIGQPPQPSPMMGHNQGPALEQAQPSPAPEQMGQPGQQGQQPPQQPDKALLEHQQRAQQLQEAISIIKDEKLRGFRVDIETDSTIQPDEDAEKERANEFLTSVGAFLQQSVPLIGAVPELMPMVSEMILFTARTFRAGRMLEDAIEQSLQAVTAKQAQAAENPQPSPEEQKMKAEQEGMQAKIAADAKAREAEIGLKTKEIEATIALEQKKFEAEHALKRESLNFERNVKHNEAMEKAMLTGMPPPQAPLPPGTEPEPGPFDVLAQQQAQLINQMAQGHMQTMQSLQALVAQIQKLTAVTMAPNEIVRDEQGRPVGSRKAMGGNGAQPPAQGMN